MDKQKDKPEWKFLNGPYGAMIFKIGAYSEGVPLEDCEPYMETTEKVKDSEVKAICDALNDHRAWVPIEEGLPEAGQYYEVTILDHYGKLKVDTVYLYFKTTKWLTNQDEPITAYRPLARPYKKQP